MSSAFTLPKIEIEQHAVGDNVWLHDRNSDAEQKLMTCVSHALNYEVLESEEVVGQAMFAELWDAAARTADDLTVVILGGRGGQALHRLLGERAKTDEIDDLLGRMNVFTQDALAPMRMDNAFSFVCFIGGRASNFKLANVMLKNVLRNRDQPGDVIRARS